MANLSVGESQMTPSSVSSGSTDPDRSYRLLNDEPWAADRGEDVLGMTQIAADIASVLVASMGSSPFALAVDAGWGMGKSTLLRLIEDQLPDDPKIVKLRFNAWTAEGANTLEGLIKSVLGGLDSNVLRRSVRRLARQRNVLIVSRLASGIAARFLGVPRLVDELWAQMGVDAKSRNEMRDWIDDMLGDWISRDGVRDPNRALVVFIDDLDRCSDDVVVKVCEALKLYLDVRGLIFVIACDQSVLARGVALSGRGTASEGRAYLEKIVQVAYRMPPPEEEQIRTLIRAYAYESGTVNLFDETVTNIITEGAGRNPRRIKRIINSFVLEYHLDSDWSQPPLGSTLLVTAIILQHLYTPFYDLLVSENLDANPIGEFIDYVCVRNGMSETPADGDDPWWGIVHRTFKAYRLQPPDASTAREKPIAELERLERQLPEGFPALARNVAFIALLRRVEDAGANEALCAQLRSRPLATVRDSDLTPAAPVGPLAGWRIVCVDDNPESLSILVQMMEGDGASVKVHSARVGSDQDIQRSPPDAVISDITRGDDPVAGFKHIAQLRKSGYDGSVVFFTSRVTPERRKQARELGALGIVTTERAVIDALRTRNEFPSVSYQPESHPDAIRFVCPKCGRTILSRGKLSPFCPVDEIRMIPS